MEDADKLSPQGAAPIYRGGGRGSCKNPNPDGPAPSLHVDIGILRPGQSLPTLSTTSPPPPLTHTGRTWTTLLSRARILQPETLSGGLERRGSSDPSSPKNLAPAPSGPGHCRCEAGRPLASAFRPGLLPQPGRRTCGTLHCAPEGPLHPSCDPGVPIWIPPPQVTWFGPDPPPIW